MSKSNNLSDFLTGVADAIRAKTGSSSPIDPQDFETEIANIPTGVTNKLPAVVDKSVTTITGDDLAGATTIGRQAFYRCISLASITIPDSVTSIEAQAFNGCTGLTSIIIPDSVTSIGASAFYNCSGLTSITIPNSVTSIGVGVFMGCIGLTSVTIPDSVTSIGESAFDGCRGLTNVTIPDSVTSIGEGAFSGCTGLTNVTIPDSVTSIGEGAFEDCSNLTSITILATTPPTLLDSTAFDGTNNCPIYTPYNNTQDYRVATNWVSLTSRIQGFAPANTFSTGDTLPATNTAGYALTWYSDTSRTQQVTTVADGSAEYYCEVATTI